MSVDEPAFQYVFNVQMALTKDEIAVSTVIIFHHVPWYCFVFDILHK